MAETDYGKLVDYLRRAAQRNPLLLQAELGAGLGSQLATLPMRAYSAAAELQSRKPEETAYAPGSSVAPILEAAQLPMASTAFSAPRGALGAGPVVGETRTPLWQHEYAAPEVPVLRGDPQLRGSMNTLDNLPFTYKGKNPSEWTPQEFKEVGDKFGVENLGPLSPVKQYKYADTGTFNIPGGTEGKFTYYDLLHMKASGIDPSRIDPTLHVELHKKLMRTMTPQADNPAQTWSGLMFGMTSPNNPLFPNQLSQSILRMRGESPQVVEELANAVPWRAGSTAPTAEQRLAASDTIANQFGLDAASRGGLGSRGSTDYTRAAELAQMFRDNPQWFQKTPNESWPNFVERLSSQVPGLSMKTGSFGSVWQDPAFAGISAIDRHMVNEFERTGQLFKSAEEKAAFEQRAVNRWNKDKSNPQVDSYDELKKQSGSPGFLGGMKLEYVSASSQPKFRTAKGEINPALPPHLANANFPVEPEKVNVMGDAYRRALEWNQAQAQAQGLNLFPSQWLMWDRIRRRLEPHENMFPGLERMPAMSREQLREVSKEHTASGHKTYGKIEGAEEGQQTLQPTKPRSNPAAFAYFTLPPIVAGLGLGVLDQQNRLK